MQTNKEMILDLDMMAVMESNSSLRHVIPECLFASYTFQFYLLFFYISNVGLNITLPARFLICKRA